MHAKRAPALGALSVVRALALFGCVAWTGACGGDAGGVDVDVDVDGSGHADSAGDGATAAPETSASVTCATSCRELDTPCSFGRCTNEGCVTSTLYGEPCDDGNACTRGDYCTGTVVCAAGVADCSDGDTQTDDACVDGGCVHTPRASAKDLSSDVANCGEEGRACPGGADARCDGGHCTRCSVAVNGMITQLTVQLTCPAMPSGARIVARLRGEVAIPEGHFGVRLLLEQPGESTIDCQPDDRCAAFPASCGDPDGCVTMLLGPGPVPIDAAREGLAWASTSHTVRVDPLAIWGVPAELGLAVGSVLSLETVASP